MQRDRLTYWSCYYHACMILQIWPSVKNVRVIKVSDLKRSQRVAGFYARHFSVSQHCDGGAYLLPVAILLLPPPKEWQLLVYYSTLQFCGRWSLPFMYVCALRLQFFLQSLYPVSCQSFTTGFEWQKSVEAFLNYVEFKKVGWSVHGLVQTTSPFHGPCPGHVVSSYAARKVHWNTFSLLCTAWKWWAEICSSGRKTNTIRCLGSSALIKN